MSASLCRQGGGTLDTTGALRGVLACALMQAQHDYMNDQAGTLRCGLVEDQGMFREWLRGILGERCSAVVEFEGKCLADVFKSIESLRSLDILLLDVRLPDGSGLRVVPELVKARIEVPVLLLTSSEESFIVHQAARSFVQGYVHKDEDADILVAAVLAVANGGSYFSPKSSERRRKLMADERCFDKLLSPREQQLISLLGAGFSDDEIAPLHSLSAGTIHAHRRNIMAKLNLHTAQELTRFALLHGFTAKEELREPRLGNRKSFLH